MLQIADIMHERTWAMCLVCESKIKFENPRDFVHHLRSEHCTKEGGSFVCRYGPNGVCPSLPIEGVSDEDYEAHVEKHHVRSKPKIDVPESKEAKSYEVKAFGFVQLPPISFKEEKWTFFSATQNMAAVLNDPNERKRSKEFFTKTWGAEFEPCEVPPLTLLHAIPKRYFTDYLKRMQHRLRNHYRIKKSFDEADCSGNSNLHINSAITEKYLKDLDVVPKTFMDANFSLEDPETFRNVIPMAKIDTVDPKHRHRHALLTAPKNSLKLMQEKLTHFLDITEVALAHQISLRSDDFFQAVSSQDRLQDDVGCTNSEIKHLRKKIEEVRSVLCGGHLKFMQLARLRSRYLCVHDKLKLMVAVQQTQPTIQLLLSTGDFVAALDLISMTQEVLQLELCGIQSLRHLGSQLAELERVIGRMMETDFIEFATTNLSKPLEDYDEDDHVMDEERLVSVLFGLLRKQKFHFMRTYKEEAFATIKDSVKETARNFMSQISFTEESKNLRQAMQSMVFKSWLEMLEVVFINALQTIKRMKILHQSFVNVLHVAAGQDRSSAVNSLSNSSQTSNDPLISSLQCEKLVKESKEILSEAGDLAQARCVKLINVRAKDGFLDGLASTDFVSLSRSVEQFVSECEEVSGRQSSALRTLLVMQGKKFVEQFHDEKKQKLSLILDNERWKQADVPAEFQTLVDSLVNGVPASKHELSSFPSVKQDSRLSQSKSPASHLVVNGEKFAVAGTLLLVLNMIVEYCQCADIFPMLTTDIMTKLFELMKMFNSRTCQLVLGAGALQLVGLKTITAKHLALASRCLEVVTLHIALFKSHFELRLPPKHYVLLAQFDQILKDYKNHRSEIFSKMAVLMEELFVNQISSWEVRPPMPSQVMRTIVKQIIKLHEALCSILPVNQVEIVIEDVKNSFKKVLAKKLASLGVKDDFGPQHGLVQSDLAYFSINVKSLHGMKNVESSLVDLWRQVKELKNGKTLSISDKKISPNR
ncbi:vacuolar protein sorting-associated protein 54-like isoform X2 [Xenia sp. Carnegie-2017]|nr:vacuolar protein sorting-associated protein 54-like isoform X2 [Xenia sp. Carnegie-2017]